MRLPIFATVVAFIGWTSVAGAQQTDSTTPSTPPMTTTTTPESSPPVTTAAVVPTGTESAPLEIPAPERTTSPINRPLMVTGLVMLGGTYGASAIVAATSGRDADKNNLYYPVVGPWMDIADRGCATQPCTNETGNKVLLVLDGVGQGLGALAVVTSLFIPEKSTRNWFLIGSDTVHAAPARVGTGYGLGAGGTF